MRNIKYIEVPYGTNAKLRINRSNIIATLSSDNEGCIDVYTAGTTFPFHIHTPVENINNVLNDIWETPEEVSLSNFNELQ